MELYVQYGYHVYVCDGPSHKLSVVRPGCIRSHLLQGGKTEGAIDNRAHITFADPSTGNRPSSSNTSTFSSSILNCLFVSCTSSDSRYEGLNPLHTVHVLVSTTFLLPLCVLLKRAVYIHSSLLKSENNGSLTTSTRGNPRKSPWFFKASSL